MSDHPEFELLQDLAKLLRKHGPDVFERLAQLFEKPEFIEQLRQILLVGAKTARQSSVMQAHPSSQKPSLHDYRLSLLNHEQLGPEKSELLVRLYDDLMAKTLLPTMRELRAFAETSGLQVPKAPSRPKAIVEIIEGLRQRSLEELRPIISGLPRATGASDRSLENWTRIIFDKDLRSRKAE
jgi:hypothetical protein